VGKEIVPSREEIKTLRDRLAWPGGLREMARGRQELGSLAPFFVYISISLASSMTSPGNGVHMEYI